MPLEPRNWIIEVTVSITFLLVGAPLCHASEPASGLDRYSVRLYQKEQGLPQNEVRSVAQTPDGYLWFSTRNGLARFDGVEFRVFLKETTAELGSNILGALLVDRRGTLWIATADGLTAYSRGRFRRYTMRDGLPGDAIHSLLEDQEGTIWVGTWHGLAAFDGARFQAFTERQGLPSNSIGSIENDGNHGLWIGTYGGGLVHRSNGQFEVLTQKDGLPSNVVKTLLLDRQQRLWIGTSEGVAMLVGGGPIETVHDLPGNAWSMLQDQHDSIWVATDRVFARLTTHGGKFIRDEAWSNQKVQALFEDREGSLWIGTAGYGASRLREGAFVSYTSQEGLADDRAESIFEDSRHDLWLGTEKGLSLMHSEGKMQVVAGQTELGGSQVRAIAEDESGRIWVGTEAGVARFDGRTWQVVNRAGRIPTDVHAIYRDRSNRLWIGSPEGVAIWDRGELSTLTEREGLPSTHVTAFLEDSSGRMWVGTASGLVSLERGAVTQVYGKTQGMQTEYVQSLYLDSEEVLWISTPGGLYRLKDRHIDAFHQGDGLLCDGVEHVLEDDEHRLWINSPQGVYRVEKSDLDAFARRQKSTIPYVAYGVDDGIKSGGCNCLGRPQAGLKMHDGSLWFPTSKGVVTVNPDAVASASPALIPRIASTVVDGRTTDTRVIGAEARRVDISFTVPTTLAASAIEFRYRMDGFENQWNEIGTQRFMSFTNLPHGQFRFIVAARRPGGAWSTNEAGLQFIVLPHFYQTWWFYLVSLLMATMLAWWARLQFAKRIEARFQLILTERKRLAQDLHDTMLQSLSGSAMEVKAALRHLHQGSSAVGIEQLSVALLHMEKTQANARDSIWDLKSAELHSLGLDRALSSECRSLCVSAALFEWTIHGRTRPLASDVEKQVYRIGLEAVTNAVRHSHASTVACSLCYENDALTLSITDNGSGFHVPRHSTNFSTHWGLTGMHERAKQCGGQLDIKSVIGQGTEVTLSVPYEWRKRLTGDATSSIQQATAP